MRHRMLIILWRIPPGVRHRIIAPPLTCGASPALPPLPSKFRKYPSPSTPPQLPVAGDLDPLRPRPSRAAAHHAAVLDRATARASPRPAPTPPLPSPPQHRRHLPSPRRRAALGQARATDDLNSPSSPRYCPSLPPLPLLPWLHTRCLMKCGNKFSRFQLLVLSVFLSVVATVVASASNCTIVSLLETKKITKFS